MLTVLQRPVHAFDQTLMRCKIAVNVGRARVAQLERVCERGDVAQLAAARAAVAADIARAWAEFAKLPGAAAVHAALAQTPYARATARAAAALTSGRDGEADSEVVAAGSGDAASSRRTAEAVLDGYADCRPPGDRVLNEYSSAVVTQAVARGKESVESINDDFDDMVDLQMALTYVDDTVVNMDHCRELQANIIKKLELRAAEANELADGITNGICIESGH